jgi:hypothetical protein
MECLKVSIIVLNYNGLNFLKNCLSTIQKQTYPDIETIVVDNSSNDGSYEFMLKNNSVKLIRNSENYGYSKANNIGAKEASGDFLLFLNNDTELFPDMIEKLVLNYKDKSILAAAQIVMEHKDVDSVGFPGNGMDILGNPYGKNNPNERKVFYADGAALFIKKDDFFKIGMFDEELFIFQEDVDLCWRSQLMGYHIRQCWDAKFYHYSGGVVLGGASKSKRYQTSYLRRYLNERNVIRNVLKNYSFPLCIIVLFILLSIHLAEIFILSIAGYGKTVSCYLKAYRWNAFNIKNTLRHRKEVQRKRVVSDFVLMKRMHLDYSKLHSFLKLGFPKVE